MDTSLKRYRYSLVACTFIIILLLIWLYISSQTRSSSEFSGEHTKGAVVSTTFTMDGRVFLFDGNGTRLEAEEESLPFPLKGDLEFITTLSVFGVKGSPMKVWIRTPDAVYCFLIDDTTGAFLGSCSGH